MRYYVYLLGLGIGCGGLCACVAADTLPEPKPPPAMRAAETDRLIIKFRSLDLDPAGAEYLQRLFRDTGVKLVHLRAMSGGAHVFHVEEAVDAARLGVILDRLGKHPDILYVEPDQRVYHQ